MPELTRGLAEEIARSIENKGLFGWIYDRSPGMLPPDALQIRFAVNQVCKAIGDLEDILESEGAYPE